MNRSLYLADKKNFAFFMLMAALLVGFVVNGRLDLVDINARIHATPPLDTFPYQFRLLKAEGDQLTMSTLSGRLRDRMIDLELSLPVLFPELRRSLDARTLAAAKRRFAQAQAIAQQRALELTGASTVIWEVDENWLRLNGILPANTVYTLTQEADPRRR